MEDDAKQDLTPDVGLDTFLDVNTGAEAIGKLGIGLLSDGPVEEDDREAEEDGAEDTEDDDLGDDTDDFEDEDDDPEDDGDELDDEEDEESDEEDPDSDESPTYTVTVDGEEVEVTLDEALRGYQRRKAFTQKTMELAEQRKTLQTERQNLTQLQADYSQRLELVEAALQQSVPEDVDWSEIKRQNPDTYADIREAYDARKKQLDALRAEQERLREEAQEQVQAHREQLVEAEQERLQAAIPEWVDPEVKEQEIEQMVDAATTYGYTPEDVGSVIDHRMVLLLRDAMRWQEHEAKSKDVKKEVRSKRRKSKTLKPGKPDRRPKKTRKSSKEAKAAKQRLRESGSVHDAAAALAGLL